MRVLEGCTVGSKKPSKGLKSRRGSSWEERKKEVFHQKGSLKHFQCKSMNFYLFGPLILLVPSHFCRKCASTLRVQFIEGICQEFRNDRNESGQVSKGCQCTVVGAEAGEKASPPEDLAQPKPDVSPRRLRVAVGTRAGARGGT